MLGVKIIAMFDELWRIVDFFEQTWYNIIDGATCWQICERRIRWWLFFQNIRRVEMLCLSFQSFCSRRCDLCREALFKQTMNFLMLCLWCRFYNKRAAFKLYWCSNSTSNTWRILLHNLTSRSWSYHRYDLPGRYTVYLSQELDYTCAKASRYKFECKAIDTLSASQF